MRPLNVYEKVMREGIRKEINFSNPISSPPIFNTVGSNDLEAVKLHATKYNVNTVNQAGRSPLCLATSKVVAEHLLKLGADLYYTTPQSKLTVLHCAVYKKDVELVKFLLEQGAKSFINQPSYDGQTPLFCAQTPEIAQLLLDEGANLFHLNKYGQNAIEHAALFPETGVAKYLKEVWENIVFTKDEVPHDLQVMAKNKAELEKPDDNGFTPLMTAAKYQNYTIAKFLFDNGVNIDASLREMFRTCFDKALKLSQKNGNQPEKLVSNFDKAVKALLIWGADPAVPDESTKINAKLHAQKLAFKYNDTYPEILKLSKYLIVGEYANKLVKGEKILGVVQFCEDTEMQELFADRIKFHFIHNPAGLEHFKTSNYTAQLPKELSDLVTKELTGLQIKSENGKLEIVDIISEHDLLSNEQHLLGSPKEEVED